MCASLIHIYTLTHTYIIGVRQRSVGPARDGLQARRGGGGGARTGRQAEAGAGQVEVQRTG